MSSWMNQHTARLRRISNRIVSVWMSLFDLTACGALRETGKSRTIEVCQGQAFGGLHLFDPSIAHRLKPPVPPGVSSFPSASGRQRRLFPWNPCRPFS